MALTNRKSIWAKSSDGSFVFDCSLAKKQQHECNRAFYKYVLCYDECGIWLYSKVVVHLQSCLRLLMFTM